MRRIAGQNDDGARRIRLHLVTLEPIAEADVENAGDDCVDPVLRMLCGISRTPEGTLTLIT
jgi:hypothetical protein